MGISFMKAKVFKRKSIMVTWTLSYLLILLLPIIISMVMYYKVYSIVKDEINRSNDFFLSQVQQYMDGIADDVKRLSVEVAFNNRIQEVMPYKLPFSDDQYYKLYESMMEIKNYKISNSHINNFFIYLKNSDTILSENGNLEKKYFYDIFSDIGAANYNKWNEVIKANYTGGRFVSVPKNNSNDEKKVYYIISFSSIKDNEISANFVTSIDESQLAKMYNNAESANKGQFMILNEDNEVVTGAKRGQLPEGLNYKNLNKDRGVFEGEYAGEKVVVSYASSQTEKCKYVYIMPESVFWQKLEYARKIIYISTILCAVLGGIVTYLLLKRNYAPMGNLLRELRGMPEQNGDNEADEYQFIKKTIYKAVSEREEFNKRLMSQNVILKNRFIERLLKGNFGDIAVNDSLVTYDINFDSDYFSVMLFYIEDFSEVFLEHTNDNSLEAFRMAQFVINNVLAEMACDKFRLLVTEADGMFATILNLRGQSVEEARIQIAEIADNLQKFIKKYYRINFTVSISEIHESIYGITEAYNETLEAMEYKIVMGVDGVIFYNDTKVRINNEYYYPIEKEQQLINCIKAGDFENVKLVVDYVYKNNFEEKSLSPQNVKCLFFNLVSTILKTINEITTVSAEEFNDELNKIQEIINYKNVSFFKLELEKILEVFCEKVKASKKNKNNFLKTRVDEYIISNYTDENLSISAVADYFDMHPSYLSKLYKAQSSEGILDQINKVRIEKSKQIMKEQKMNLDEVARATGYSNVRTFTRAFMKIEGITPGKYKETNQII